MKVLGFTVVKKDGYYKAYKKIEGKMRWVYIGKSCEIAEKKILQYCEKHQLSLETEVEKEKQKTKITEMITRYQHLTKDESKVTEKISLDSQKIVKILYRLSVQDKHIATLQQQVIELQQEIKCLRFELGSKS